MTHYDTLGCPSDATPEQIKAAFRRARSAAHPDRHGGSEDQMKAVNRAFDVLSDPERRAFYDATGLDQPPLAADADKLMDQMVDGKARELLRHAFSEQIDVDSDRLMLKNVGLMLAQGVEKMQKAISSATYRQKKLSERRGRITAGSDGENLVHALIDEQLEALAEEAEKAEAMLKVIHAAQKLLTVYGTTEPVPQETRRYSGGATTPDDLASALQMSFRVRGAR